MIAQHLLKFFIQKIQNYISNLPDKINFLSPDFSLFRPELLFLWVFMGWVSHTINTKDDNREQQTENIE